jgi:phosphatidylserine decarboxylase
MKICDREGNIYTEENEMGVWLDSIYSNTLSRACMKILSTPFISKAGGILLDSAFSAAFVDRYAEKHGIDMFDYEDREYLSFNDFFTRKIKHGRRTVNREENTLVCPSDGKVSAYTIADSDMFVIKNSVYTAESLLRDRKLAKRYSGGTAVIIRLTPDDYHRYIYPTDGIKSHNRKISGALNTVRPTVNKYLPVYKENSREYCMIRTENFGDIIQMEVGAMMVGKITNNSPECTAVKKGEEKGRFEFGGSTIILLLEPEKAKVCDDLLTATKRGYETKLRMGDIIAHSV